ncbi:hypothetical protein BVG19_g5382 [[Candida] boidinii]|nr:hypothetical protein BVG19_g5382 [[Candida] boidinii]OWB48999.1 hypothetical protein B5S27_g538 [[Candida] boidinii]
MMSYQETTPSLTSNRTSSTRHSQSVYQTDGRPLSEEAIYKAKVKYGVYQNPSKQTLGVDPSASDTAALLAASTNLEIHPYRRELAADAATAALIAKNDSAPKAWKRNSVAPEAEYAAISAKSQAFNHSSQPDTSETLSNSDYEESAASSVLKKSANSVARDALQDLYDFDDVRSGKVSFTNAKFKLSTTLDYRSGINTDPNRSIDASRKMKIGDITRAATLSASKAIDERINPLALDYRSGLQRSDNSDKSIISASKFNSSLGNVDISKITSSAEISAKKSITARFNSANSKGNYGIPTPSDRITSANQKFASVGALASQSLSAQLEANALKEKEALRKNSLIDKSVLTKAIGNANSILTNLDNQMVQDNLFGNREMNLKAVEIAQKNLAKRNGADADPKVNLGGGLSLSPLALQALAESIVKPIIDDIDTKVHSQRVLDEEKRAKHAEQSHKREEYFTQLKVNKIAHRKLKENEKVQRREKLQSDKDDLKNKQVELTKQKQTELEEKEKELSDKIEEETQLKADKDKEREDLLAELAGQKSEADGVRQAELDAMQKEKDDEIAPTLEELSNEKATLDDLTSKRVEVENYSNEHKARLESYQKKLDLLERQLQQASDRTGLTTTRLSKAKEDSATLGLESANFEKEANTKIGELNGNIESLTAEKPTLLAKVDDLKAQRADTIDALQKSKLEHVEKEKEINEALPEHLRKDVSDEISVPSEIDETPYQLEDEHVEKPEVEPVEPIDDGPEFSDEDIVEEPEKPVEEPVKDTKASKPAFNFEPGEDPLKDVDTIDKPAMADVVSEGEVAKAAAYTAPASATSRAPAAAASKSKTATTAAPPLEKKKSGFGSKLKSVFSTSKQPVSTLTRAPIPKAKKIYPKKVTPKASENKPAVKAVETVPDKPTQVDNDVFSGFSQGSDVEIENK